jgi:TolB-like protein/Flp pilus assembly protein TadD
MSGDPEKEYFSDGITEDLITNLARSRWFSVAARNSTFVYKGKAVDVSAVGRALHVGYVLEGSVRKSGNRVRVTAQLIETESGSHIWAERYDREITDIFDLQDEITLAVVQAIEPALWNVESRRAVRKDPQRLDAWDCVLRAFWHAIRMTRDDNVEAIRFARRAVELDPTYARAWSNLAFNLAVSWFWGWAADREAAMAESLEAAQRALRLDSEDAETLGTLALIHAWRGAVEKAIRYGREGLRLDAGELFAIVGLGLGLIYSGEPDEAIAVFEAGLEALSGQGKTRERWPVLGLIGLAHLVARRYEKAIESSREAIWANSDYPENYRILAAAYAQLGAIEEGRAAEAEFRRRTLHGAGEMQVSQQPALATVMAPMIEGIAKLGLK